MAFPPKAAPQMNNGETSNEEGQSNSSDEEESESESSSMAPPEKMKGDKPHPLRQWADEG